MGSAKSRNFFEPYNSSVHLTLFNTIATPYGIPIMSGLFPLAMPFNLPWGLSQMMGTEFGSRLNVLGG